MIRDIFNQFLNKNFEDLHIFKWLKTIGRIKFKRAWVKTETTKYLPQVKNIVFEIKIFVI